MKFKGDFIILGRGITKKGTSLLTKTKSEVRISRKEWERLRKNPNFTELIEFLEDREDLRTAKLARGKDLTLDQYLTKRGIRNRH